MEVTQAFTMRLGRAGIDLITGFEFAHARSYANNDAC